MLRTCKECKNEFPVTHFPSCNNVGGKVYYRRVCKQCYKSQRDSSIKKCAYNQCSCGKQKYYRARTCATCKSKISRSERRERTLASMESLGASRTKWAQVRRDASQVLEEAGREKECDFCGFDVYVECCHIKPIADFTDDALLKDVNDEKNLIYLCPNHHVMMDRGLIHAPVV